MARLYFNIEQGGSYTEYEMVTQNTRYDPDAGVLAVDIRGERTGQSAIVTDGVLALSVDGQQIAERTGDNFRRRFSISGEVDLSPGSHTVSLDASTEAWGAGDSTSYSFTFEPPFDSAAVSLVCDQEDEEVVVGEQATVPFTIENGNPTPAAAIVEVTFGDATATIEADVPSGGSREVSATFTPEAVGEITPEASLTVTRA